MNTLSTIGLACALAVPTVAQNGRFFPSNSLIKLQCRAPQALSEAFAGTNLGDMLASDEFSELIEPVVSLFQEEMGEIDQPEELERLMTMMGSAGGWLEAGIRVVPGSDGEPSITAALSMSPGGDVDLQEIVEFLQEIRTDDAADDIEELDIAGVTFECKSMTEGAAGMASFPRLVDGHLVMFISTDFEKDVETILQRGDRDGDQGDGAPFRLTVDLPGMRDLIADAMAEEPLPIEVDSMLEVLRLDNLPTVQMVARPEGKRVNLDTVLEVADGPSLLDLMRPAESGPCRLLGMVPAGHEAWSVMPFRFDELWSLIGEVMDVANAGVDMNFVEDMMEEELGVRLGDDFMAHMGTEILSLTTLALDDGEADMEGPGAMLSGSAYILSMRDAAAFSKSLDTALRSRGLHASRKKRDYRGFDVYSMSLMGLLDLSYVAGDGFMAFGFGATGDAEMRRALDIAADRRDGKEVAGLPESVSKAMDSIPGAVAAGSMNTQSMASMFATIMSTEEIDDPEFRKLTDAFDGMAQMLGRFDLGRMDNVTAYQGNRMIVRYVW